MNTIAEAEIDLSTYEAPEYLISKINNVVRERMNFVLRQHGLKLVEWRMLQVLDQSDAALTVNELAELCVIERTVASKIIDAMTKRGLLEKRVLKTDRRHSLVQSTKAGKQAYAKSQADASEARARIFRGFSASEIETLLQLLERMYRNMDRVV